MFLQATYAKKFVCLTLLALYRDASNLSLNLAKSTLIDVNASHFDSLIWPGKRVNKGSIFCYFGYPLGVLISSKDAIS